MGLMDTRKGNSGRPLERKLTDIEIIERKDTEIAYLRSELSIVKKLDLNERQVRDGNLESRTIFPLVEKLIKKYSLKKMTRYLCNVAGVSRSGYYNYLKTWI